MPVATSDRPLAAVREETIDQLVFNYGHAQLSLDAFERRLEQAMDAETHAELASLTADLDLKPDDAFKRQRERALGPAAPRAAQATDLVVSVLGGTNRRGAWEVAEEIRVINVLGGTDIDFTDAVFTAKTTRVKVFCLLGGVDIQVPEGVNTVSRVTCILGGMDNRGPTSALPGTPTVIVEGFVLLGGADIKVKRPLKDRLVDFANEIKKMFTPSAGH